MGSDLSQGCLSESKRNSATRVRTLTTITQSSALTPLKKERKFMNRKSMLMIKNHSVWIALIRKYR